MSVEATEQETRTDVVPQKEELEREKLLLEIQKLKDPWWKNPAYILAGLPTMLAILTLIYGFTNGYFQATAIKLENQKHALQADINKFSELKGELERQNKDFSDKLETSRAALKEDMAKLDALHDEQKKLQAEINKKEAEQERLQAELPKLESLIIENEGLKNEIARLKNRR